MKKVILAIFVVMSASSAYSSRHVECKSVAFEGLQKLTGLNYSLFALSGRISVGTTGALPDKINHVHYVKKGVLIGEPTLNTPDINVQLNRFKPNYLYLVVHKQKDFCIYDSKGRSAESFSDLSSKVSCDSFNKKYILTLSPKRIRCKRP